MLSACCIGHWKHSIGRKSVLDLSKHDQEWDGRPINEKGMYSDIPLEVYHHDKRLFQGKSGRPVWSISSSGLRTILCQSPAHYWVTSPYNRHRAPHEPETEAQIIGRAIHHRILGQDFFDREYVVRPEYSPHGAKWHGSRSDCKNWEATVPKGRAILTPKQMETVLGVLDAVERHPQTRHPNKILRGWVERSLFWRDAETGVWLKSRPDAIPDDGSTEACDLKTTRSVLYPDLVRTIQEYGYHQQAALTRAAFRAVFDVDLTAFTFLFIEKQPPYCIALVELRREEIDRGEAQNRAALYLFTMCARSGQWPGPMDEDYRRIGLSDYYHEYADRRVREINADWAAEQNGRRVPSRRPL